jgi:hypothetical protein
MSLAVDVASGEESRAGSFPWRLFVLLALVLVAVTPGAASNPFNGPMVVAERLLAGEASLPPGLTWMEGFNYAGKRYLAYPPMATFILVPYAALGGGVLGQGVANSLLIFGSAILLYLLLRRIPGLDRLAPVGAFVWVVGTPLLYSAHYGNVWLLMHSEGQFFLLLALYLAVTRKSFFWAGFAFMVASLTRYAIVFSAPAFVLLAFDQRFARGRRGEAVRDLALFAAGAAIPTAIVLLYNWWVFADPLKNPYVASWRQKGVRWLQANRSVAASTFSLGSFRLSHVGRNLWFYLTAQPMRVPWFPYVRFTGGGEAIWLLSPFFLGIVVANLRIRMVRCFLAGALPMFAFYLLYSYQGYLQFGSRYLSDILPFLVPIALSGFTRASVVWRRVLAVLVVASVAFNAYGVWVVSTYGHGIPKPLVQKPAPPRPPPPPVTR